MFGAIVFLPLFLQAVTGASATNSGLLLLPLMAGLMTTSVGSGRVLARPGPYRRWPLARVAHPAPRGTLRAPMGAPTPRPESALYLLVIGPGLRLGFPIGTASWGDRGCSSGVISGG